MTHVKPQIIDKISFQNAFKQFSPNFVSKLMHECSTKLQLSILKAAKTSTLSPSPITIKKTGYDTADRDTCDIIELPRITARSLAAIVYIQKFRLFAKTYCQINESTNYFSLHPQLMKYFDYIPLHTLIDEPLIKKKLQFLLTGPCPVIHQTKLYNTPFGHEVKPIIRATKRLRAVLDIEEKKACRVCPKLGRCPFAYITLRPILQSRYIIRILCGMHHVCATFVKYPELKLHYNPQEMTQFLELMDCLDYTVSKLSLHLNQTTHSQHQTLDELVSFLSRKEAHQRAQDYCQKQTEILNIPTWMQSSIKPTDAAKMTASQKHIIEKQELLEKWTSPSTTTKEPDQGILNKDNTNFDTFTKDDKEKNSSCIQHTTRNKKPSRQLRMYLLDNNDDNAIWVPEIDPTMNEFGGPNGQPNVKTHIHTNGHDFLSEKTESSIDHPIPKQIIDIDTPTNLEDNQILTKRFNYYSHHLLQNNQPEVSLQQTLYQRYLKSINALPSLSTELRKEDKTLQATFQSSTNHIEHELSTLISPIRHDTFQKSQLNEKEFEKKIKLTSECLKRTENDVSKENESSGMKWIGTQLAHSLNTQKDESTLIHHNHYKHIRSSKKLWKTIDNNVDPIHQTIQFDYINQSSSGSIHSNISLNTKEYTSNKDVIYKNELIMDHYLNEHSIHLEKDIIESNKQTEMLLKKLQTQTDNLLPLNPENLTAEILNPREAFPSVKSITQSKTATTTVGSFYLFKNEKQIEASDQSQFYKKNMGQPYSNFMTNEKRQDASLNTVLNNHMTEHIVEADAALTNSSSIILESKKIQDTKFKSIAEESHLRNVFVSPTTAHFNRLQVSEKSKCTDNNFQNDLNESITIPQHQSCSIITKKKHQISCTSQLSQNNQKTTIQKNVNLDAILKFVNS